MSLLFSYLCLHDRNSLDHRHIHCITIYIGTNQQHKRNTFEKENTVIYIGSSSKPQKLPRNRLQRGFSPTQQKYSKYHTQIVQQNGHRKLFDNRKGSPTNMLYCAANYMWSFSTFIRDCNGIRENVHMTILQHKIQLIKWKNAPLYRSPTTACFSHNIMYLRAPSFTSTVWA